MKRVILFLLTMVCLFFEAEAKKLSGSVICGTEKLEGVVVTDGTNFTSTKSNGKFSLNARDDAEFVYILTPSGYVAPFEEGTPQFYQKIEKGKKTYTFDLLRTSAGKDYSFAAVADPQTKIAEQFETFSGEPFEDLKASVSQYGDNAFILVLGDICSDSWELYPGFKELFATAGVPVYCVPGNHDHNFSAKSDYDATREYRDAFGPENYAFFVGDDVFIGVDNIVSGGDKKYINGYSDEVVAFVKHVLRFVPETAKVYIFQHSTVKWRDKYNKNGKEMLRILSGRDVKFISGHSHVNEFYALRNGIEEHNIAAIHGNKWNGYYCVDGSPRGYRLYENRHGKLKWYYKGIGMDKSCRMQCSGPGQSKNRPNSVLVNVWDWDPLWKVEWYEDGVFKGKMEKIHEFSPVALRQQKKAARTGHIFACNPGPMAKTVTLIVRDRWDNMYKEDVDLKQYTDIQTSGSVKTSIDRGVNTVCFGLTVTADGAVVCSQNAMDASAMIDRIETYTMENGLSPVRYNIEIETGAGDGEGRDWPHYKRFSDACMQLLVSKHLGERLIVSGRDFRALNYMYGKYPEFRYAYVAGDELPFEKYMEKLEFVPEWLSPVSAVVDEEFCTLCGNKGIKILPRGVNEAGEFKRLQALGIRAVVTDCPDILLPLQRGY